jgi:hypothetical protein
MKVSTATKIELNNYLRKIRSYKSKSKNLNYYIFWDMKINAVKIELQNRYNVKY